MDDGGPTAYYIFCVILLLVDAFLFGFGAAIKELNAKEISEQAENNRNKKAGRIYKIIMKPEHYINTLQFIVTLIYLFMGGFLLEHIRNAMPFQHISVLPMVFAGAILLYIVLTFGVLIPKKLGTRYAEKWAYACVNLITLIAFVCTPITGLISLTANGILRLFGIRSDYNTDDVTEEEIISMVNEGHEQGVLLATEAEMITNIFEFGDKEAQDIMTHRKNILAIDRSMTLAQALDYMLSESKSRFPVYEENIDNIVGILHFRDAMRARQDEKNLNVTIGEISHLVRDTMFIPETKHIDDLFQTMQHTKTQMVIVVDEYGQTTGLLAMEDILEEIVGNIMDEYDEEEAYIEETENADEYMIEGVTPLRELEDRFHISFHEEEFETLNGFMISKMDKIPEEDEDFSMDVDSYRFAIRSVENRMIKSVLVTRLPNIIDENGQPMKIQEKDNEQE